MHVPEDAQHHSYLGSYYSCRRACEVVTDVDNGDAIMLQTLPKTLKRVPDCGQRPLNSGETVLLCLDVHSCSIGFLRCRAPPLACMHAEHLMYAEKHNIAWQQQ